MAVRAAGAVFAFDPANPLLFGIDVIQLVDHGIEFRDPCVGRTAIEPFLA